MFNVWLCIESCIYREGLAHILAGREKVLKVDAFHNIEQITIALSEDLPDVIVLDAAICGGNPDCAAAIRKVIVAAGTCPVVALGLTENDEELLSAFEAGAAGCVTRAQSTEELVQTIYSAAAGELRCNPRIARQMQARMAELARVRQQVDELSRLSQREHLVLRLLEQRMSNKQIARQMGLELSTIKNHVHNILVKLDVSNRVEAAAVMRVSSELRA